MDTVFFIRHPLEKCCYSSICRYCYLLIYHSLKPPGLFCSWLIFTHKPSMISLSSGHFKLPNIRLLHCHMCHYSFEAKSTFKSTCTFAKITLQLRFQKPRLHNSVPVHCTDPVPILRKSHLHWQGHFQALMRNKKL